ncbi:MAG: preprotein translocase subunit SecE [Candidatus Omnitrophica bacterium]|nr:preprotein translocase subunit SecE [Candidatus Omnitrophota bacterium]
MKIFSSIITFVNEVKLELSKVAWSSRQELLGSTAVVIVTTVIMTLFVWVIDLILSKFLTIMLR